MSTWESVMASMDEPAGAQVIKHLHFEKQLRRSPILKYKRAHYGGSPKGQPGQTVEFLRTRIRQIIDWKRPQCNCKEGANVLNGNMP